MLIADYEDLFGEMVRRELVLTGHKLSRYQLGNCDKKFVNFEFNVMLTHKLIHAGHEWRRVIRINARPLCRFIL
jgi:hypothetical protein